jgi:hypothetical protein
MYSTVSELNETTLVDTEHSIWTRLVLIDTKGTRIHDASLQFRFMNRGIYGNDKLRSTIVTMAVCIDAPTWRMAPQRR